MGTRVKKVFLPSWQRRLVIPVFGGIWVLITYIEFFSDSAERMGLIGYLIISAFFLGMGIVAWLMASGKLPSAIIKEETK
jgi:hypothetical protein